MIRRTAVLIFVLACTTPVLAQGLSGEVRELEEQPAAAEDWDPESFRPFELRLDALHYPEAEGDDLELTTTRVGGEFSVSFPASELTLVTLGLGWEHSFYDLDGVEKALPGTPDLDVDGLDRLSLSVNLLHFASEEWIYFGHLSGAVAGERGVDPADAFQGGLAAGASYTWSPEWTVRFGLAAFTRLEADPDLLPVLGLDWAPAPEWMVMLGLPQTRVEYTPMDDLTLFLGGRFDFQDYRLDQDGPFEDAVLRDDALGLELGFRVALSPDADLELTLGQTLSREITLDDDRGDELTQDELDDSWYVGLTLSLRF